MSFTDITNGELGLSVRDLLNSIIAFLNAGIADPTNPNITAPLNATVTIASTGTGGITIGANGGAGAYTALQLNAGVGGALFAVNGASSAYVSVNGSGSITVGGNRSSAQFSTSGAVTVSGVDGAHVDIDASGNLDAQASASGVATLSAGNAVIQAEGSSGTISMYNADTGGSVTVNQSLTNTINIDAGSGGQFSLSNLQQTDPALVDRWWDAGGILTKSGTVPGTSFTKTVVTLSAAQIATLGASPIVVVDPPGAGILLVPVSTTYDYDFGTVPYTGTAVGGLCYNVGGVGTAADGAGDSTILAAIQSSVSTSSGMTTAALSQTGAVNQGLYYYNSGAPAGGDGTLTITVITLSVPIT